MQNKNKVFAIGRGVLFPTGFDLFEGYKPATEKNYSQIISREASFVELAGNDKQICPYIVFINPPVTVPLDTDRRLGQIYTFNRGVGKDLRISFFLEGVVSPEDTKIDNFGKRNILKECALREAKKQILPQDGKVLVGSGPIGFVNFEDSGYSNKFGLVYVALVQSKDIKVNTRKTRVVPINGINLKAISELEMLCRTASVDKISKALLDPLKEYDNFC